ncbi:MAG: cyclic nucleotide-binding domain-containing protein [Candidatus Riflebacteria bacterium]|nr:cyclic nucleotide-binding domain-containing protein [Candidatus Riflebacteria bacterium]
MLDKIELFSGLNSKELKDVENIAKVLTFARGETVFNQGDYSSELYIIETGQVEISVKDILQNKRVLSIVKNGDFFGEMALFDKNSTRSATAKAVMNTNLIVIPRQEFERLLQSRPQISFKLLSALSRRLREANLRSSSSTSLEKRTDGRVIVVAAPQNGYGKTTMATTLAHLLTAELEKRVLYIDLDLCFGEGTFVMGIYSPRSIVNLCQGLRGGPPSREDLFKHFVRITDNLFVVPAPTNFLDGENVKGADLVSIIKTCKPHFDYIIIDSDSSVEERLLNAFDLADHILFLVQTNEVLSLKSNVRYFHGLEKLNYPEDRMSILIGKVGEKFDLEKSRKLFKFKVIGGLPFIPNYTPQYGRSVYHLEPTGNFVAVARGFMKGTFREEFPGESESGGRGFLYRLFFDKNQKSTEHNIPTDMPRPIDLVGGSHPSVSEEALSVLLKYIRTNVIYGNLEEARFQTLKLLEFCQNSSTLYQILGEIFMLEKNFSEAIDAFKRAIEIDPENYLAIGYLGDLSSDDACFERAVSLLKAKLEKTPNYPDLLNDMGKLLYKKGDYAKAEQMFRTALEKNVGYLEGHINLAVVLGETGKFD